MFKRKKAKSGGFWLSVAINLALNWEVAAVAAVLLVLHFAADISLIWFFIALGAWIIPNFITTVVLCVLTGAANSIDDYRENKNPYSAGANKNPYSVKADSSKSELSER